MPLMRTKLGADQGSLMVAVRGKSVARSVGSLRSDFLVSENRRHSRGLEWSVESQAGISQKSPPGFGALAAPVSARVFSISVLRRPRLVRITTETGSLNVLGHMAARCFALVRPKSTAALGQDC